MNEMMELFDVLEIKILIEKGYKGSIIGYSEGVELLRNAINMFMETGNVELLQEAKNKLMTEKTSVVIE